MKVVQRKMKLMRNSNSQWPSLMTIICTTDLWLLTETIMQMIIQTR